MTRASDHIGIVRYVKDGRVYTVEGNASNKVSARDYALSDTYIVGYGRPKYGGIPLKKTALALEDVSTGLYTVTHDFVNLRSAPSTSGTKLGSLSHGTLVAIKEIQNGWGRLDHNGKVAYISLDYADFTSPVFYTVTYTAKNAENLPPSQSYFSFEVGKADTQTPLREGFAFHHWRDAEGGIYAPGDPLPQGDLALTAVFEPLPVEAPPTAEGGALPEDGDNPPPVTPDAPGPSTPQPRPEQGTPQVPTNTGRAAAEAGTVSGVLSAVAALWWYIKRFLIA